MKQNPIEALQEVIDRVSEQIREGVVVEAYLAGGMGVYANVVRSAPGNASEARYSEDADIAFAKRIVIPDDILVTYQDVEGKTHAMILDRNYAPEFGPLHPDAYQDSMPFLTSKNRRLRLNLLKPLDLAVSKVGRFQDHDRHDIALLARSGLLNADDFVRRAEAALEYYATDPRDAQLNIKQAVALIHAAQSGKPAQ